MAIIASDNGIKRELVPAGNYIARCYQMIHIGTSEENIKGQIKRLNKIRIGWELPLETKVFDEAKGPQPLVVNKEFTLSLNEKANLRKMLASWRGKDFTEEQAKNFDVLVLLGIPCMVNVIHKTSSAGNEYEDISSISPIPKGMTCPDQVNKNMIWEYDKPNWDVFSTLPDFLKDKIKASDEYKKLVSPNETEMGGGSAFYSSEGPDDLPF